MSKISNSTQNTFDFQFINRTLCPASIIEFPDRMTHIDLIEIFQLPPEVTDLCIFIPMKNDLHLDDYLNGLIKSIDKKSISCVYQTDGFIIVFMNDKKTVDLLIHEVEKIIIHKQSIALYPIPHLTRKIYFKCKPFSATNFMIQQELENLDVKIWTPVEFIPVSTKANFQHVVSGLRQATIFVDDIDKLPAFIIIEGSKHRVQVFGSSSPCRSCQIWKENVSMLAEALHSRKPPTNDLQELYCCTNERNYPSNSASPDTSSRIANTENCSNRRPASTASPGTSKTEHQAKRMKCTTVAPRSEREKDDSDSENSSANDDDDLPTWKPLQNLLEKPQSAYPMKLAEVKEFIRKLKRKREARFPAAVAQYTNQYHTDIPRIVKMLKEIHPFFPLPKWKMWCTQLTKKLDQTPEYLPPDMAFMAGLSFE